MILQRLRNMRQMGLFTIEESLHGPWVGTVKLLFPEGFPRLPGFGGRRPQESYCDVDDLFDHSQGDVSTSPSSCLASICGAKGEGLA